MSSACGFQLLDKFSHITPVHESMVDGNGNRKQVLAILRYQLSGGNARNGIAPAKRDCVLHFRECEPRESRITNQILTPRIVGESEPAAVLHSLHLFIGVLRKYGKIRIVFEEAETECPVIPSYGRRHVNRVVLHDIPIFDAQLESLCLVYASQQEMHRIQEEGFLFRLASLADICEIHQSGDPEKGVVKGGEELEMLSPVPFSKSTNCFICFLFFQFRSGQPAISPDTR